MQEAKYQDFFVCTRKCQIPFEIINFEMLWDEKFISILWIYEFMTFWYFILNIIQQKLVIGGEGV